MINLGLQVRRALPQDQRQISSLIFQESNTHRHLDWRTALEWLGEKNYWVLEEHGTIVAALACPEDPQNVAWIRLFTHAPHLSGLEAWSALWNVAQSEIFPDNPDTQAASIVMKQWFQSLLLQSGFTHKLNIILLELKSQNYHPAKRDTNIKLRPMYEIDLQEVTQIDFEAFGGFWHNSLDSIQRAYKQSFYSTVAEHEGRITGYQISTGSLFGVHLARLGVRPEAQGRGIGTLLVDDLIHHSGALQTSRLSVNTQDDNAASLKLYEKMGFVRTGEYFPVLLHTASITP